MGLVGPTREDEEEGGGEDAVTDASTGAETKGVDEEKDTGKGVDEGIDEGIDEGRADSKDMKVESPETGFADLFDPVLAVSNDAVAAASAAAFKVLRGLRARTAEHAEQVGAGKAGGAPAAAEAGGGGGTMAKLTAAAKAVAQAVEMCGQRQREAEAAEAALTSVRASAKWEEASLIRDAEEQALQVRNHCVPELETMVHSDSQQFREICMRTFEIIHT